MSVLMAWYGVNFVLGKGLHSYGFGVGGFAYVISYVAIELAFVGFATWRRNVANSARLTNTVARKRWQGNELTLVDHRSLAAFAVAYRYYGAFLAQRSRCSTTPVSRRRIA